MNKVTKKYNAYKGKLGVKVNKPGDLIKAYQEGKKETKTKKEPKKHEMMEGKKYEMAEKKGMMNKMDLNKKSKKSVAIRGLV